MPMSEPFRHRLFPILPEIVREFGTPVHIYDEAGINETANAMNEAYANLVYRNYFAVKASPNPAIMKILARHGFGFDCSSVPELRLAREIGATGDDIMSTFNNNSAEEFAEIVAHGGSIMNLDDISHIDKVPKPFPKQICFRYNPGKRLKVGNNPIGKPEETKYGITHDQVLSAYTQALIHGVEELGLHTMVCSNERRVNRHVAVMKMILDIAAMLKRNLGIEVKFVNPGGGYGIPYRPGHRPLNLRLLSGKITRLMYKFGDEQGFIPRLYTECGRYVTGPYGVLVASVINQKHTYRRHVGVDAGMQCLMRPAMYGAYHHVDVLDRKGRVRNSDRLDRMNIVGSICESIDMLAVNRRLSEKTTETDIVVVHDTGAHGIAMCFQYNGRLRPKELLLKSDGSVHLIRRAETVEDYFTTLRFAPQSILCS